MDVANWSHSMVMFYKHSKQAGNTFSLDFLEVWKSNKLNFVPSKTKQSNEK